MKFEKFLLQEAKSYKIEALNIDKIKETYLTDVFRTIEDDQIIFKKVSQKHLVSAIDDTETISQLEQNIAQMVSVGTTYAKNIGTMAVSAV